MATPIELTTRRCGSRVEFSATTAKTTSPGCRYFKPSLRGMSLQYGGKMDETRTRFCAAMPASRSAISKEVRRSLCLPTPLVKKRRLGTMSLPNGETLRREQKMWRPTKLRRNFWCTRRAVEPCQTYHSRCSGMLQNHAADAAYRKQRRTAAKSPRDHFLADDRAALIARHLARVIASKGRFIPGFHWSFPTHADQL